MPRERLGWYGIVAPLGGDCKAQIEKLCQDPLRPPQEPKSLKAFPWVSGECIPECSNQPTAVALPTPPHPML